MVINRNHHQQVHQQPINLQNHVVHEQHLPMNNWLHWKINLNKQDIYRFVNVLILHYHYHLRKHKSKFGMKTLSFFLSNKKSISSNQ
jgi:hypothetical protein